MGSNPAAPTILIYKIQKKEAKHIEAQMAPHSHFLVHIKLKDGVMSELANEIEKIVRSIAVIKTYN